MVVPNTSVAGLDFDWTDVAGATSYVLEVTRTLDGGATQVGSVTSTTSRALYSSSTNPLVPGTTSAPNSYTWSVTAYQGTTASQKSAKLSFTLIGGTLDDPEKPAPGDNPPLTPSSLSPVSEVQYTLANISKNGVVMQWEPVAGVAGYEIQLVRAEDQDGNTVEKIHYRMDVASTQAVVTNLTLFGVYRFEVRSISTLGSRSSTEATSTFQVVEFQASDIYPESPDSDGVIDEFDLFSLALDWHRYAGGVATPQAINPQADIVSADKFIEQADLVAFLIQFHGEAMKFPQARATPTPAQLDAAVLLSPVDGASVTLAASNETLNFSWSPVPYATSYQLFVRNTTTFEYFFFTTTATEFPLAGYNFEEIFLGGGEYTWEVLADADGFIESGSVRRSFTLTLNYTKTGKAATPARSFLGELTDFFLGQPASAAEPVVYKDDVSLVSPELLFPFAGQVITSTSPFPLMWAEVPNATTYAVEVQIPGFTYFNVVDHVRDSENLNIVTDDVVGDGIVAVSFQSTYRSTKYQFRVQARNDSGRGEFTGAQKFTISATGERPYEDIDFNQDGEYKGDDVLLYSRFWRSKWGDLLYDEQADLAPTAPDYKVNAKDLISLLDLFTVRRELPKYPSIDAPRLITPEDATFFGADSVGQSITFSWDPPLNGVENFLAWEMELNLPTDSSTPLTKQFFSATPEYTTRFSLEGFYSWRVRAIDNNGTRGTWSSSYTFAIDLDQYQPVLPAVVAPVDGAVLTNGAVQFEWTRISRESMYGVYDRLEIQNGDGPITALDIYHRHSESDLETVQNSVPLAPVHGTSFRWRVSAIYVIQDTYGRLYLNKPAETPEWHTFTLKTSAKVLTGLACWNPDITADGHVNLDDNSQFQSIWRLERNGSSAFIQEADFNMDAVVDVEDAILMVGASHQGQRLADNGFDAPVPTYPIEPTHGKPPVILAMNAQWGIGATWGQISGINRYLIEWIDSEDNVHALYADKLSSPDLLSPVSDKVVTLPNTDSTVTLTWTVVPDAAQYSAVLVNVNTGQYGVFVVDAGDPAAETYSLTITREELESTTGGAGSYEYRVLPIAPGHFADTSVIETFAISFTKDGQDYYSTPQPITKAKPPIVVEGTGVLPAFSYYGLYSWRVMGMADDLSLTPPSRWNRFGIQCLGPAYGDEVYCGQEEPGP